MPADKFPKRNYAPRPRRTPGKQAMPPRSARGDRGERGEGRPARPHRDERGERRPPRAPRDDRGAGRPASDDEVHPGADAPDALPAQPQLPAAETAWEPQAGWYDQLHGERGDDFHSQLLLPAVARQLQARPGQRILDVCCGQGVLGRFLGEAGMEVVGVDASPSLVAAATARAGYRERYVVGDARTLDAVLPGQRFDHAALVMAVQDLDPIEPVFAGLRSLVKPGGRIVIVMTHPCFRIPKRTSWGFDEEVGVQYRRLKAYMSPIALPIRTHPGQVNDSSSTTSFHRPLHHYLTALGTAGLAVVGCEELCSTRRGTQGIRSSAEDRAAKEFPVFMVITATRLWRRTMVPDRQER
ncbi:MAG TPA: methyltransferase domain-containing protein [Planctomycetota bacterium]|nr:methyltransferase domain-containing protein [Planctomycetota bacterium]